jgi:hypothetical protein
VFGNLGERPRTVQVLAACYEPKFKTLYGIHKSLSNTRRRAR